LGQRERVRELGQHSRRVERIVRKSWNEKVCGVGEARVRFDELIL